jgi:hypothetical protein
MVKWFHGRRRCVYWSAPLGQRNFIEIRTVWLRGNHPWWFASLGAGYAVSWNLAGAQYLAGSYANKQPVRIYSATESCGGKRDLSNKPIILVGVHVLVLLRLAHAGHLMSNEAMRPGRAGRTDPRGQ